MVSFFVQLSIVLVVATVLALLARYFRQPAILAFVVAGILIGPMGFGFVSESEDLALFSQIGVALLLFIVGISLNPRHLKDVGRISLITGLGQILFTSIIGYFIARLLDFGVLEALYISIAFTFSSTIIIIKLLTDKNDIETLYGRIAVGFLLVQDFVAVLLLVLVSGLTLGNGIVEVLAFAIVKGILLVAAVWLLYLFLLRRVFSLLSRNQELLYLASIAWCFIVASAAMQLGFTLEIGAFLAGLALATSEFGIEISSKIRPLRDFFIALFFISLGIGMVFSAVQQYLLPIILFSLFILIGNPLIVFILMILLGYRSRTSFLAGLTVAQISEFSLILVNVGLQAGHVSKNVTIVATMVGIITITASTYLILHGDRLYSLFGKYLQKMERTSIKEQMHEKPASRKYDVLLFGCHRMGSAILTALKGKKVLVIDYNPEIIEALKLRNIDCLYADANDSETIADLVKTKPSIIVSTLPYLDYNLLILKKCKRALPRCLVIATAKNRYDFLELYKRGADLVIFPEWVAGQKVADYLTHLDVKGIRRWGRFYFQKFREDKQRGDVS